MTVPALTVPAVDENTGAARLRLLPLAGALLLVCGAVAVDALAAAGVWGTPVGARPDPSLREWAGVGSGIAACLIGLVLLPPWTSPRRVRSLAPAVPALVIAATLVLATGGADRQGPLVSLSELLGLFMVATAAAARGSRGLLAAVGALVAAAFLIMPIRLPTWDAAQSGWLFALGTALFIPGLYIRWRDHERAWRTEEARRQERLAIARDLHDTVAHQVTGIVVQIQAMRHVADRDPALVAQALPDIERAGTSALAAMRRMVGALREEGEPAPVDAWDLPGALRALAVPGGSGRLRVAVDVDAGAAHLPQETAAAVIRMVQEAVANARRHARGATEVAVRLRTGDGTGTGPGGAVLEVADNGRAASPVHQGEGGYGLIGMAERVRLLGGEFAAGPLPDGRGWRVRAELPAPRDDGSGAT